MTDTTGKRVTLPYGAVVTDYGEHHGDPLLRHCVADDGSVHVIIARVIRDLPETYHRDWFFPVYADDGTVIAHLYDRKMAEYLEREQLTVVFESSPLLTGSVDYVSPA